MDNGWERQQVGCSRRSVSNIGRHHRHTVKGWGKPDVVTHHLITESEPESGPGPSL